MKSTRPNLVLIMTDQQRGDCLGIAGHPEVQTPNLDFLAARGARFSAAFTECPVCIPARHTLMTGMAPDATGCVGWSPRQRIADPATTLPELLRQSGYQTAMIGRGMHQHPGHKRYGFEEVVANPYTDVYSRFHAIPKLSRNSGFSEWPHMMSHGLGPNEAGARPWPFEEEFHQTNYTVNKSLEWLDKRDREAPFFLSVGFTAPHPPLVPPAAFYERYLRQEMTPPVIGDWATRPANDGLGLDPNNHAQVLEGEKMREIFAGYYGLISHVDNQLMLLLARLKSEGDTYILFTSDHGEMLGDHYLFRKSLPYQGSVNIPFILNGPSVDSAVCEAPVGLQDVLPTFCEIADVKVPSHVTGHSVLQGLQAPTREWIHGEHAPTLYWGSDKSEATPPGGHPGFHYATDGKEKYIWFCDGREHLFDLQNDPRELRDLSQKEPGRVTKWRERLIEKLHDRPEGWSDGKTLKANPDYAHSMPHAIID